MNASARGTMSFGVGILGIVAALLVFAVLTDRPLPLISSDRAATIVLLALGFTMCAVGSLRNIQPNEWTHPANVVAAVLGGLALLLGTAVLLGISVPLISSDRTALVILAIIVLTKVVLARLHHTWLAGLAQ